MGRRFLLFTVSMWMFSFFTPVDAQITNYHFHEQWYVGLTLGSSTFYGDLTDKTNKLSRNNPFQQSFYNDRKFMYGLTMSKRVNGAFWLRANFLSGNIQSTKESVNMFFKSNMYEFSLIGMVNFSELIAGGDRDRPVNIYGFAGIGMASYASWKRDLFTDSLIRKVGNGKRNQEFLFPFGVGVDYKVNNYFTVNAEVSMRKVSGDDLDAHLDANGPFEGFGYLSVGINYQFDMPQGVFSTRKKYTGKSTDPALKAYNRNKKIVMKTKGYRKGMRYKRSMERKKKEWALVQMFKKTRVNIATE
ncbi:MAG: outer membrane beta-barrel protein [Bacteroidales bacterium]|nr:outer membrane beta-barrel protein [Bacteroidales bacterium]